MTSTTDAKKLFQIMNNCELQLRILFDEMDGLASAMKAIDMENGGEKTAAFGLVIGRYLSMCNEQLKALVGSMNPIRDAATSPKAGSSNAAH